MLRRYIALLIAVCTCFALSACQQERQSEQESQMATAYTFEKTIRPVGMHAKFGVVDTNIDPQFASEGKKSIRLTPMGSYEEQLYVYFPFRVDMLSINYTDLNYVSSIELDVYAPEDMNLGVGLYFSSIAELKAEAKSYALKQGWNTLSLPVQHSLIALQYDLADCYGAYVQFEESAVEKGLSVYVDNIRVEQQTEPVEVEQNIILDEWDGYCELADFEHAYQQILATPYTTYNKAQLPDVKVVKAADYGFKAASGEKVLRIESYPSTNYGVGSSWTQLAFSDKWFETLDISRFKGEGYYLKLNVYQQGSISTLLELNMYHAYGMEWGGVTTKEGQWVELSTPLDSFTNWLDNPEQFVLAWLDWNPELGESCVFYIDNIRIEKENG